MQDLIFTQDRNGKIYACFFPQKLLNDVYKFVSESHGGHERRKYVNVEQPNLYLLMRVWLMEDWTRKYVRNLTTYKATDIRKS